MQFGFTMSISVYFKGLKIELLQLSFFSVIYHRLSWKYGAAKNFFPLSQQDILAMENQIPSGTKTWRKGKLRNTLKKGKEIISATSRRSPTIMERDIFKIV